MRIEDELQTKNFRDEKQKAQINILFTASWLNGRINNVLKPYGITHEQYNILRILRGSHPKGLSVIDIKGRMIDRMSNVSRLIEKLRKRELVARENSLDDRRMVTVELTETGIHLLKLLDNTFLSDEVFPEILSESEAVFLSDTLDKLRIGARKE